MPQNDCRICPREFECHLGGWSCSKELSPRGHGGWQKQWLNQNAFVSVVYSKTGACVGSDSPANCKFGNSGRNSVRGLHYTNSDIYITKTFPIREGVTFRFDTQMVNAFTHPNFVLPGEVEADVPGESVPARSERWKAPFRRLQGCWVASWVAIALRA